MDPVIQDNAIGDIYEDSNAASMMPGILMALGFLPAFYEICPFVPLSYILLCIGSMIYHAHKAIEYSTWTHRFAIVTQHIAFVVLMLCKGGYDVYAWQAVFVGIAVTWHFDLNVSTNRHIVHAINACGCLILVSNNILLMMLYMTNLACFIMSFRIPIFHAFFHTLLHCTVMCYWGTLITAS